MTEAIPDPEPRDVPERSHLRELLRLGVPLVAGMGGHALFNIVDLAMVGAYRGGAAQPTDQTLSAVGIASLVTTAPIVFMNGISNGSVTVIARAVGARQTQRANQFARQGLLLAVLLSVVLGVIPGIFADAIATEFRTFGWERTLTVDFLRLMSLNAWSAFLLMQITANLRAVGFSISTMALLMLANLGNVVFNWVFIFGHLGFDPMGPIGAAWATVVARGVAAVAGLVLLVRTQHPAIRLTLSGWMPRARFMWGVMRAGMPVALQWTVRMTAIALVLLVIAPHGPVEKAAYGVGTRLDMLALFAGLGWGAACAAMVSHGVGRGAIGIVRRIARDSAVLNVAMMSIAGALYFAFAPELIQLFSLRGDQPTPQEVIDAGVTYMRIAVLSYPGLALCVVWAHAMNGIGSLKTPLLLDTVGLLLVQVPLAWWLSMSPPHGFGIKGAWWALVISHSLLALVYYLVFRGKGWERKRRR